MTTKEDIYNYIEWHKNKYNCSDEPIFEIQLFEKAMSDGFNYPDTGVEGRPGFYYELDTAIHAMNQNWADIQDHAFRVGFILCHFPGLYECATTEARMYFVWDEKKQGFYQAEEPEIFRYYSL